MTTILQGHALDMLRTLEDESVHSVVTDPPYELGFMGKAWDNSGIAYSVDLWREVLRVLKPGGHLLSFGGSRTYHRMACAIEDAGFEIRDQIQWIYGQGFPKSLDVSKAIDKMNGDERPVLHAGKAVKRMIPGADQNKVGWEKNNGREFVPTETSAASAASAAWEGWGTALKPAHEPICMARKPLSEKNVAANVLKHGTGAMNIDGCRIEGESGSGVWGSSNQDCQEGRTFNASTNGEEFRSEKHPLGRWPSNVILDQEAAELLDEQSGNLQSGQPAGIKAGGKLNCYGTYAGGIPVTGIGDSGGASRFFYCAKSSQSERGEGNNHPTVKPLALMRYLVRMVTPPGGLVCDPFAGSGTTGVACELEGFDSVLIELLPEHCSIIEARLATITPAMRFEG